MSRSWERKVERNRKLANKQRARFGQAAIGEAGKEPMQTYKGRSWFLPLLLIGFAIFFSTLPAAEYGRGNTFWFTLISYLVLAVFIYFVRRPFLRIGKSKLTTRRFGGDKTVEATDIEEVLLQKGYVVIRLKSRRGRWVFSRLFHQYDIPALTEAVKDYATRHHIPIQDER